MHFIEILLGISIFIFLIGIAVLFFNNFKNRYITNLATIVVVVSLIAIIFSILIFIADSLLTVFIIWFGNW